MRLSDALAGYWLEKSLHLSAHTRADYTTTFTRLSAFLGDPIFAEITADDIRRFLAHVQRTHNLGKKTIVNYWIALSSLWSWAEIEHDLRHIIRGKVKRPRYQAPEIEPLEPSEIAAMIDAAQWMQPYTTRTGKIARGRRAMALRDTAIILTLLDSGLRAQELCDLQVKDYDKLRGRLHVRHGKGDKSRFVPLCSRSQQAIQDYLNSRPKAKQGDPLFSTRTNTHILRDNLGNILEGIASGAGVSRANPHRWRHTFAIGFLRAGGNALLLQKLMGHATLEMTMKYVKFLERDISGAGRFSPADRMLITESDRTI
jgi:integrase/recombinase XerD